MNEHSRLPPSSAARRVACPGSRYLESQYPENKESPHAREGEAAHEVASLILLDENFNIKVGDRVTNGEMVTQEMIDGAELYFDNVVILTAGSRAKHKLHVEERVNIYDIHEDAWGTPDCWQYDMSTRTLRIWDYKYGFGLVDVFENWQLIAYAAGILSRLGINGIDDQQTKLIFTIVQPRGFHRNGKVRIWSLMASELRPYFNKLRMAEEEASHTIAKCHPNPECDFCRGRHACTALQRSALSAVDITTLNVPFDLTAAQTGIELGYLKHAAELLDARITGLSEQALSMLRRGERVPGFKAEQSEGREIWKKPIAEVLQLGVLMGVDVAKPADVVTPKQAVKMGLQPELLKEFAITPRGAMKLVQDNESTSRKIFGGKQCQTETRMNQIPQPTKKY